jgi:hypothetical protein
MKKKLTYLLLIITAILAGYYLGQMCLSLNEPLIDWLGKSLEFGFEPTTIGFSAFTITLGIRFSINFLQILFIALAVVIAPKVAESIK